MEDTEENREGCMGTGGVEGVFLCVCFFVIVDCFPIFMLIGWKGVQMEQGVGKRKGGGRKKKTERGRFAPENLASGGG